MNSQKKEEVIPSILAKESLNLELRLRRCGEKNFRDLFIISENWLGLIWIFFQIPGPSWKLVDCGLILEKVGGYLQDGGDFSGFRIILQYEMMLG
jgi:hypothetical protein